MIVCHHRQLLSLLLSFVLLLITLPLDSDAAAVYQSASLSGADYSGQGLPFTTEELQGLVAPIALYPDPLVAQVLVAATFPDQIVDANAWLQQNKSLTGAALIQAVTEQPWDPGVKALTQFPQVLSNMAQNLAWTSQLGEAYHNQQSAVMSAVQSMRAKAKADGNLKSFQQMTLAQPSEDIIMLQSGNPVVVYVPQYNPALVYGTPIKTPGYSAGNVAATGEITFAGGVAIGALSSTYWGWGNWGCNWYHGDADFRNYPYYGNHAWHGGNYGGYNYYGNHPYHNDANRPFSGQAAATQVSTPIAQSAIGNHAFNVLGTTPTRTAEISVAYARESGGWANSDDVRGWGKSDAGGTLTAFSTWGSQSELTFGGGGWGDRTASYRGWVTRGGNSGWGIGGRSRGLHW